MGSEDLEDQRRHTAVTSQHGRLKARSESRGKHGIEQCSRLWLHNITFYGQVDAREKLMSSSFSFFVFILFPFPTMFDDIRLHVARLYTSSADSSLRGVDVR